MSSDTTKGIGTMAETSLHAALKKWYMRPGDRAEVNIDGYLIDIVRGDLLIEIQTGNFSSIKRKLTDLTERHPVRLVFPIAKEKWINHMSPDGQICLRRNKSPKRGEVDDLFVELVSFPELVLSPRFSLDVLLMLEDELRRETQRLRRYSRSYVVLDRKLIDVVDHIVFQSSSDFLSLLPIDLGSTFTTRELAKIMHRRRSLVQKMVYCLRGMGALQAIGKEGNALLYARPTQS